MRGRGELEAVLPFTTLSTYSLKRETAGFPSTYSAMGRSLFTRRNPADDNQRQTDDQKREAMMPQH